MPVSVLDRGFYWAAEQTPRQTDMDFGALLRVRGPAPDRAALMSLLGEHVERAPVLAYRLTDACWRPDPEFEVDRHVRHRRLAPGTDPVGAVTAVRETPLPGEAPLWDLTLLDGYDDGEYALCYRVHHAFQDGMAMAATLETLFGQRCLPPPHAAAAAPERQRPAPQLRSHGRSGVDLAFPLRRRPLWPPRSSPLTGHRRLQVFDLDSAVVRTVARGSGATRNQVCLAALAGALRDSAAAGTFTTRHPGPVVTLPLHLRSGDVHAALGNTIGMLPVTLPCAVATPADRLRHLMHQTRTERLERHRARFRTVLRAAPFPVLRPLFSRLADPRYIAAMATTIRLAPQLAVAGAPVREVVFHPPLAPGHALVFGMLQQGERVGISVLSDTAIAVTDALGALLPRAVAALHDSTAGARP